MNKKELKYSNLPIDKANRGTFIDGIAASQNIDSAAERLNVEGVDISMLPVDGVFNYEHDKTKMAGNTVGKIYEAKKIFKDSDCENERHLYYWNKVKFPFIYVAGELFDAVGHQSAEEIAAMLRYDKTIDQDRTQQLIHFSIDGSRIDQTKNGDIKKSIARKVAITLFPCNKVCIGEELQINNKLSKNLLPGCEVVYCNHTPLSKSLYHFSSAKVNDNQIRQNYLKWQKKFKEDQAYKKQQTKKITPPKNDIKQISNKPLSKGFFVANSKNIKPSGSFTDPSTKGQPAKLETSESYKAKMQQIANKPKDNSMKTKTTNNLYKAIVASSNVGTPANHNPLTKSNDYKNK